MGRNLLLHLHGTAHRPINAIENNEKGIATSLNIRPVLIDGGVY